MQINRPVLNPSGLLNRIRKVWLLASSHLPGNPDPVSLLPPDTLQQVRSHILSVHETLEQQAPSKNEIGQYVGLAVEKAGGVDRLVEGVDCGRLAQYIDVRPLKIEMDILNKCNLRCPMCMMSHPSHYRQPLERMSLEVFERLADEIFWHVRALSFTFGAEPLLHPQFPRFVEIAARYRIPQIYIVTNGMLLTDEIAQAIVTHGMHVLAVSVDAAHPQTYDKIRIGGDWDRLMRNLNNLQRIKRELGSPKPHLELTFVMMQTNIEELPEFIELAASLGANSVNAIHMVPFEPLSIAHESCSLIPEKTNKMLKIARKKSRTLGIQFSAPALFGASVYHGSKARGADRFNLPINEATKEASHCPFPWHFAAIDMHGEVHPCGWWNNQPGMGSIKTESFLSIWKNENYRKLRAQHTSGALCATCRNCPAAGVGCVDSEDAFQER